MKNILFAFILPISITFQINAQWFQQSSGTTFDLHSVFFINENNGIAVGDGPIIIKTTNGGANWIQQQSNLPSYEGLYGVCFKNENEAMAVSMSGYIIKTTDGGSNWNLLQLGEQSGLYGVAFNGMSTWIVVGLGTILKTTNDGVTWKSISPGGNYDLMALSFSDINHGFAVGFTSGIPSSGVVLNTNDGGESWSSKIVPNLGHGVSSPDSNHAWIVGYGGILFTSNGGINWIQQLIGEVCTCASFIDSLNGWVAGQFEEILRTTDGGRTWEKQPTPLIAYHYLNSISFVDSNNGWVVGDAGTIYHTTNGGVTFIENENHFTQPVDFLLEQNFPNPFNPTTKISYQIPTLSFVNLKVYDILGKEVAILVNEEKPIGNYEVEFRTDDLHLSSGIYFYRLQAGDFVGTKKMILLR